MTRCPECAGKMEWNSSIKQLVCISCGLSLSRNELDNYWKKIRSENKYEDEYQQKKARRKDWLEWYSKSKAEKERY
ncbi:MAG: hypothetical protein GF383_09650 [Candidatus Lokiarchaeota archaeon]|nr:hypothetical protein [Candidatus Lokiarchaeota archaeon]